MQPHKRIRMRWSRRVLQRQRNPLCWLAYSHSSPPLPYYAYASHCCKGNVKATPDSGSDPDPDPNPTRMATHLCAALWRCCQCWITSNYTSHLCASACSISLHIYTIYIYIYVCIWHIYMQMASRAELRIALHFCADLPGPDELPTLILRITLLILHSLIVLCLPLARTATNPALVSTSSFASNSICISFDFIRRRHVFFF